MGDARDEATPLQAATETELANSDATNAETPVSEGTLADAWRRVQQQWDDEIAHERFVALCHALGDLAYAGGQYRQVAEQDEARREVARRQIDAVITAATAELMLKTTPPARPRLSMFFIAAFVVSTGLLLWSVKVLMSVL